MPVLKEIFYDSCNFKNKIYVRIWEPDSEPVGVVQICHGIGEHIKRYDDFAKFLASHGYIVVGDDHLGHGLSVSDNTELGYVGEMSGWDMMIADMRKLYERMHEQYQGLPYFIFGHSMGSFLTRTYIIRYHDGPDGVILSGTGHQSKLTLGSAKFLARQIIKTRGANCRSKLLNNLAFGSFNRRIADSTSDNDWLSTDKSVVREYDNDPLCGGIPSAGLFYALSSGLSEITAMPNIMRVNKNLPIYLYAGDSDPVGNYGKGVEKTYEDYVNAGLTDLLLRLYPGARHESHNEFCKNDVYNDVLAWLEDKRAK